MRRALLYLLILSVGHCYLFNGGEARFAKNFYFEECLHSNQTICITVNLTGASLERTCVADETKCVGEHSSYLRRTTCESCADFWCEDSFLCTNEESLCGISVILETCGDNTPNCYPRGTLNSDYGVCTCAPGFTGDSCSECETSPKPPEMEYVCCEDESFEHGVKLIAVKRKDIGEFLGGKYTGGNCTSKISKDCDCLDLSVSHAESGNPYLFYRGMNTNDTESNNKLGQGILAFIISLAVGLMLVFACGLMIYYVTRSSKKKKARSV